MQNLELVCSAIEDFRSLRASELKLLNKDPDMSISFLGERGYAAVAVILPRSRHVKGERKSGIPDIGNKRLLAFPFDISRTQLDLSIASLFQQGNVTIQYLYGGPVRGIEIEETHQGETRRLALIGGKDQQVFSVILPEQIDDVIQED